MKSVSVNVEDVRPGDIALHHRGLDEREVTRIEQDMYGTWHVWLRIEPLLAGPFPAENYDFIRRVEE